MRVLIADDHPLVRKGIKELLRSEFPLLEFEESSDGETARNLLSGGRHALAVFDISMPGRGGLELIHDALDFQPWLKILVLSVFPEREFAERAYRAGAVGYICKTKPTEELLAAVKRVLDGGIYVSPSYAELLVKDLGYGDAPEARLSDRELSVARLFAAGRSLTDIGRTLCISVKTVSSHKTRVMQKLGLSNNAEIIARFSSLDQAAPQD